MKEVILSIDSLFNQYLMDLAERKKAEADKDIAIIASVSTEFNDGPEDYTFGLWPRLQPFDEKKYL